MNSITMMWGELKIIQGNFEIKIEPNLLRIDLVFIGGCQIGFIYTRYHSKSGYQVKPIVEVLE